MARIRSIKPEFWTDEKVVGLSPFARLLFIGLWNFVDDDGRTAYSPARLKMQILPADPVDISELLGEIRGSLLIDIYVVEEKEYLQVCGFAKHQKVDKRSPSKLPAPPKSAESPRNVPPDQGRDQGSRKGSIGAQVRKTTMPENWKPSTDELAYAKAQGCIDPSDTAEGFRLHHKKNGTKHADWHAAFQFWCRNEKNFRRKTPVGENDPWAGVDV